MRFAKVHGNGNDFIVINNMESRYTTEDLSRFARLLCRRKFSIGADGLLVVGRAGDDGLGKKADFAMRIFNADGSEGEMCGNGARALARYAFEKKLAGASMRFTTLAGLMCATVEPPCAELDMGDLNPVAGIFGQKLWARGVEFPFVFLTAGVPHCVLFPEDCESLDAEAKKRIGKEVSHDFSRFPEGANVSFAQVLSEDEIRAVTYERGVEDLTESCGTGCVAVAAAVAAGARTTETAPDVRSFRVHNPGGSNEVRLRFTPDGACRAWLKGRTAIVAEGDIFEDAWL
jgi:diaminopimelate epimerase